MTLNRPLNATEYNSYKLINDIRPAKGNGYLEDVLASKGIQELMPRVIKALEDRGYIVSQTFNHSSFFANEEEVKAKGNGSCMYTMYNPSETEFVAFKEKSKYDINGKISEFEFDRDGYIGTYLDLFQVYRSNGSEADCSIRVSAFRGSMSGKVYDRGELYSEDYESGKRLAWVKIDYRASDRVINNRINKLFEQIQK